MPPRKSQPRRREKAKPGDNLLIGAYLKHARLNQRRSLRQLSDEVGCSESFLSKVENDKLRPSLAMLHRIVSVLGVSIGKLFVAGNDADPSTLTVVRANNRPILKTGHMRAGTGITLESLVPMSTAVLLEANIHRVAPGGSSRGLIQHQGEEMGFVLEGRIELNVQGKKVTVNKGDTFFFQSHLKHGYRNPGKTEAQIVWINTPQSF
ncbi:cupin domain-containing protein [Bradyrhizobium sp. NP1]|jgi:mannose-6-phosphate isomerase-like protein (cupin superfamily)/DNA-binding XRE family transcriptional regulator|uniref:cupin domain-containing protein n=1 Tax=Bradyrhizobium sp. NP1 TaxID=3049772 RepID=UPI0025A5EEBD|nr:cupin domain-containing protein [Bradyrhizobium sp. NP1]WJR80025.1 cupin domain-containing protein [Bradyrhizobium sp. NP1]